MSPLRIGIVDHGFANWQGGQNYLLNLKGALAHPALERRFPYELIDVRPGVPDRRLGTRLANRLALWSGVHQPALHRAIKRAACDFAYYCGTGSRLRVGYRSAHWIADFQSVVAPEFSPPEHCERARAYIGGVLREAQQVVLSSRAAREDCERVMPGYAPKTMVLPFRSTMMLSAPDAPPPALPGLQARYGFVGPFAVVSNQWWRSKNHACVLRAAELLRDAGTRFTVLCTGAIRDNRDPAYGEQMMERVSRSTAGDTFKVLSRIPLEDLVGLMRHSSAVLQPSLFEGWSTSVEEARCLGKTTIASDIAVHREQASPFARYFDPADPGALAIHLARLAAESNESGWDPELEQSASKAYLPLVLEFAEAFLRIARG